MAAGSSEGREEELLRINAELAAEIRSLSTGRISVPRSAGPPAARRLSRLISERDSLVAELAATKNALEQRERELSRQVDDQARRIEELSYEVNRLRGGLAGLLRRARARLLRR
jgi:translation initiation factor 2B subunit (eIF-2B alpha/beta/delta family)